jgi:hypothetical protein
MRTLTRSPTGQSLCPASHSRQPLSDPRAGARLSLHTHGRDQALGSAGDEGSIPILRPPRSERIPDTGLRRRDCISVIAGFADGQAPFHGEH